MVDKFNPYKTISDNRAYKRHLYHLFEDKKFIKEAKKVYYVRVNNRFDTKLMTGLLNKYCLKLADLDTYMRYMNQYEKGQIVENDVKLKYSSGYITARQLPGGEYFEPPNKENDEVLIIEVLYEPTTTYKEYMDGWKEVSKFFKKTSTKRGPDDTKLIYSIFKARLNKVTFKEIFRQYQEGVLLGYDGPTNQFNGEDSLERYYNKYKPIKPYPDI